jgi:chorismate mutase/prephenate dehydratase
MNIPEHRKAIDKLDAQIVKLLNERTQHVLQIGDIKLKAGEEIYAPHRERAVLERICKSNNGPITNESLRAIYREIMSSALSLEKSMTIAYLGPEATFTHQAAIRRFGSSLKYSAQKTVADVFSEVSKNRADYGVVPIENSTEGIVRGHRHSHAGHVRGQRFEDCGANRFADSTLPGQQLQTGRHQKALFASSEPWAMSHLGSDAPAEC